MVVGSTNSWVINARTSSNRHFVGTHRRIGLSSKASREASWRDLKEMAIQYSSLGADVVVYALAPHNDEYEKVGWFHKNEDGPYMPPGCMRSGSRSVLCSDLLDLSQHSNFDGSTSLRRWDRVR